MEEEVKNQMQTRSEEYGKHYSEENFWFKLGRIAQILAEYPQATISVTGYADSATGTPAINSELAAKRAAVVAAKLRDEGIDPNRISYTSEEGDWNKSASPEANRRVTVRIVNE